MTSGLERIQCQYLFAIDTIYGDGPRIAKDCGEDSDSTRGCGKQVWINTHLTDERREENFIVGNHTYIFVNGLFRIQCIYIEDKLSSYLK